MTQQINRLGHGGYVLLHVLITTVIVVFIAASLAQMLMMRYTATQRATAGAAQKLSDYGGLSNLLSAWNAAAGGTGQVCAAVTDFTYNSGAPGSCNCVLTSNSGSPRIYAHVVGSRCKVDICTAPYSTSACP